MEDWQLLEAYAQQGSEIAFAQLVERHLGLVHAAARRQVGDDADDVAQAVFLLLAQKAGSLGRNVVLSGWLFRTTRFVATRVLRSEIRRQRREHEALTMNPLNAMEPEGNRLYHVLDENLAGLAEGDRNALLLRFAEGRNHREVGVALGVSEEAAKKRVNRALDRLRVVLAGKGVTLSVVLLATSLAERLVALPPVGLAGIISSRAMSGATPSGSAAELARQVTQSWRWTQLKFAAVVVGIALLIGISAIAALRPGWPRSAHTTAAKAIPKTVGNAGTAASAGRIIPVGASFHLQVVAADTGEAISGAKVLLTLYLEGPEESISRDDLVTDSFGVCDVPLPEDTLLGVFVGVNRSGWENRYFNWLPEWQYPLPSAYVMRLERAESIGGRVVDATHRPVAGVAVRVSAWVGDLSGRQPDKDRELPRFPQSVFLGTTDAQGRWVCHTLSSAGPDVSFQFEHADYLPNSLVVDLAKDLDSLADLRARRLETVLQSGVLALGEVVNPAGEAISGARIAKSWEQPGVTTDANGQFKFRSLSSGEIPLVATAKGFAPQHFTGVAGGNPVRIQLQLGGVLRVRVLTTEQEPIMGATLALNDGFGDGALGWDARTDVHGRVAWESAPPNQSLFFYVSHRRYVGPLQVSLRTDGSEQTITLNQRGPSVSGSVVDAATGRPIAHFKVIPDRGPKFSDLDRAGVQFGADGQYRIVTTELVRVEAGGYTTELGRPQLDANGELRCDFKLKIEDPHSGVRGVVLNADGTLAVGAEVALCTLDSGPMLARGTFVRSTSEVAHTKFLTNTDGLGRFVFPIIRAPHTVVAVASTGFGRTRVRAGQPTEVRLEPFGTIEGVVLDRGDPVPGEEVALVDRSYDNYPGAMMLDRANFGTRTDKHGRFQIGWIPAGDGPLYLELSPLLGEFIHRQEDDQQPTPSSFSRSGGQGRVVLHKADDTPVGVVAGQTTSVLLGDPDVRGRTAVAHLRMAEVGILNDWQGQLKGHALVRSVAIAKPPEGLSVDELGYWLVDWYQSETGRTATRQNVTYTMEIGADGTLTARGVLPGDYRLFLSASGDGSQPDWRIRENYPVTIPESAAADSREETVDLGKFELKIEPRISK